MKVLAGAATGAFLLALAAPAVAGGYWDARAPAPPPPEYAGGPPPCGCGQDRGYQAREQLPPRPPAPPPEHVALPAEFFEGGESSVGPPFLEDAGGGGGAVEAAGFGGDEAFAFASASASAHVDVNVRIMQHVMMRNHMMMQHHMQMHRSCGCSGHRW